MHSESRSERREKRSETAAIPDAATTSEALERQLGAALDAADEPETQFHLRQALQLVEAFDE